MTICVCVQARSGSSRWFRKIYEDLSGKTTLYRVLEGVTYNKVPQKIILAMPDYDQKEFEERLGKGEFDGAIDDRFCAYFGHPDNLVDRYYNACRKYNASIIARVTADCPYGGLFCDEMLLEYLGKGYNGFMGNNELVSPNPYPDGVDLEIFSWDMLCNCYLSTQDPVHREHVTPYFYRHNTQYKIYSFLNQRPNSMITMKHPDFSFDTEEDRRLLIKICKHYDELENTDLTPAEKLNKALLKTEK